MWYSFCFFCIFFYTFVVIYSMTSKSHTITSRGSLTSTISMSTPSFTSISVPALKTHAPMKILLIVEPTPFNYVSGYANRFKEMLKYLKEAGDDVCIITPDDSESPPTEYLGFPIVSLKGFRLPFYNSITLSCDFSRSTKKIINDFKPDIIHVTSPGFLVLPAIYESYKSNIPLLMSYHTNIRTYAKSYFNYPGSISLANFLLRFAHDKADLTLVTSPQLKGECQSFGMRRLDIWQKGINSERFSPTFKNSEMRNKLSDGHPDQPLLIYVGRIGLEKKLHNLKIVLDKNPGVRLALVGIGPAMDSLKKHFEGYPVHFAGQMNGDPLSEAYASADVFVMPSDSETLGFVVLESMASGVPVVGVAAGGVQDLIQDDKNGFLVENNDNMIEFSKKVQYLTSKDNKDVRDSMGVYARTWSELWSWKSATSRLRNIQYPAAMKLNKVRDEDLLKKHIPSLEEALLQRIV